MPSLMESSQCFVMPVVEFCTVAILYGRQWFDSGIEGTIEHATQTAKDLHESTGLTVQIRDFEETILQQFGVTEH